MAENQTAWQSGQPLTPLAQGFGPGPSGVNVSAVTIYTCGAGYSINDQLTVIGGTFTTAAQVIVSSVDQSGSVLALTISEAGNYSVIPTNPVSTQYSSSGSGSGLALTLTFSDLGTGALATASTNYDIVPFLPAPPASPLQQQQAPYLEYSIDQFITSDAGYIQQPIAGPAGTQSQIARAHGGVSVKYISFYLARLGQPPQIPSSAPTNVNDTLNRIVMDFKTAGYLPDGTRVFTVSGVYEYFMRQSPQENVDSTTLGAMPFTTDSAQQMLIGPAAYQTNIMGPSQAPAGSPSQALPY
jgi:hypothetical protein